MAKRAVQSLRHYLRQVCAEAAPPADADLLRQFLEAKDHRAFEILLDRHGPMVLGTARRLVHNAADADDVFQAVFLSLARLAKAIRRGQSVPNWLYTTTCRIAARARKRRAVSIDKVPEPSASSTVETDLVWREVRTALDEELQRLPARLRSPLLLCYLSGLTRDEAAQQLGWSLGTLKRRLEEGRAALRERLERRGISGAGLALAVLSPSALDAAVRPALAESCLAAVFGKEAAAGASALLTTTTTFKGVAMKAVLVSLALLSLGVGIYAGLGRADPSRPVEGKKSEGPTATAKKFEAFDDPLPAGSTMRLGTSRFRSGARVNSMAVSADGKTAFLGSYPYPRAFDLVSGRALFTLKHDATEALATSPDGRTIVSKRELHLYLCDSRTGQELRTIKLPTNPWLRGDVLALTPDGKSVATISDGKAVHLIDFESGKPIRDFSPENPESSLPASFQTVLGIAFSADGKRMATGGFDNDKGNYFARLWDVGTGKELRRFLHGRSYGITSLAFSPDGKTLATGSDDGRLRLFDVDTGNQRKAFPKDSYGYRRNRGVAFAPDGKTVATAGASVHLYDATTGEERLRIDRAASNLHFGDEGKTLTGAVGGAIYRWDTATGKALTPDSAGDSIVDQILVTADGGRIVTRGQEGDAHIWDGSSGNHLRFLKTWRSAMALSRDDRYLAWAHYDNSLHIRLYDLAADRFVERFPALKGSSPVEVAFPADGKTLLTFEHQDGMVRLWNVETGKEQRSFQAVPDAEKNQTDRIRRVAISPDGTTLAVATPQSREVRGMPRVEPPDTIRLWDVASGKELRQLEGNISSWTFSPDGRLLVTSGATWEVATGKRVPAATTELSLATFSPDGRSLATASHDGTIRVWETATWTERTRFKCHHEWTTALAFTPAGQILCGGGDTTVLAYDVRLRPPEASGTPETAWNDLTNRDASRASKSQGRLLATPAQAVKLFAEKIKAVEAADAERLRQLIADLDSEKFTVREAASKSLSELGEKARPALEEAVRTSTSLEVARRAKTILSEREEMTPEQLRQMRAVEVLERIASEEAKKLLRQWAAGAKGAVLTEEARAALGRLDRSATSGPGRR